MAFNENDVKFNCEIRYLAGFLGAYADDYYQNYTSRAGGYVSIGVNITTLFYSKNSVNNGSKSSKLPISINTSEFRRLILFYLS